MERGHLEGIEVYEAQSRIGGTCVGLRYMGHMVDIEVYGDRGAQGYTIVGGE